MHRKLAIDLIENYTAISPKQEMEKFYMLDFIRTHNDCFSRQCSDGHITCGCFLENFDGSKFLLTKHRKACLWMQVGGHADGECDPIVAAEKEAHEESGLENIEPITKDAFFVSIHMSPEILTYPPHFHYDIMFLFRATDEQEKIKMSERESLDLQWFSELPEEPHTPELGDIVEKWKNFRKNNPRQ